MRKLFLLTSTIFLTILLLTLASAADKCYQGERYSGGWVWGEINVCYTYLYNSWGTVSEVLVECNYNSNGDNVDKRMYLNPTSCDKNGCDGVQVGNNDYYRLKPVQGQTEYVVDCWMHATRINSYGTEDWMWSKYGLKFSNLVYTDCNAEKCDGLIHYSCNNHIFVNDGKIKGKCGVDCVAGDTGCGTDHYTAICNPSTNKFLNSNIEIGKCGADCLSDLDCANKSKPEQYYFHTMSVLNYSSSYYNCISNKCTIKDKINVYDNTINCTSKQIYMADANQTTDFDLQIDCFDSLKKKIDYTMIIIYIAIALIIIITIFIIYLKTKKKRR